MVGPFELKKKEDDDEPSAFYNIPRITVAVYFKEFESVTVY